MSLQNNAVHLLTAQDVAKLLQISMRTLWRMDSGGRIPKAIRMGGVVRWRADEIQKWIAEGCPTLSLRDNVSKRRQ